MANTLTGDFEAVLQVSAGTLQRLVAGMHQNAPAQPGTPSIPHVAYLRLADEPLGQHGSVAAQIGVPVIRLIDGATDRFGVEVGIRARYRPDPGTLPLADVIHGTVFAEYRLRDIDGRCRGWEHAGDDYFWFRVVKDTVRFSGTVFNDSGAFDLIELLDEAQVKAHIERHLRVLLDTTFEPTPQHVGARFRRIRTLSAGPGPNDAAVAVPWGLSSDTAQGSLNSVHERFLQGHDWGLAVSAEYILSRIQPMVDPIVGSQTNIYHRRSAGIGGGLSIDYHVRIDSVTPEWLGPISAPFFSSPAGVVRVRLAGVGWASRLYRSGIFNVGTVHASDLSITFTIDQYVFLTFDESSAALSLSAAGPPVVSLVGPWAGLIDSFGRNYIINEVKARIAGPLAAAQAQLNAINAPASRDALVKALTGLDAAANPRITHAIFRTDGLVLCGPLDLSHRPRPRVAFEKTPWGDGFDAIESWIPGGRIDTFHWTWRWFHNPIQDPPGSPGSISNNESYMLRRPISRTTRYGLRIPRENPLPGLDGHGKVCLAISGVQVDPFTGALVPIRSVIECEQYGFQFTLPYEVGPLVRIYDPRLLARQGAEVGIMRVAVPEARGSANTLILAMGERWDDEGVAALQSGLDACSREDASMLVVLLLDDGLFGGGATDLRDRIKALAESLPAPLLVTEDVRGSWTDALSLPTTNRRASWRLLNPSGVVTWAYDEMVAGDVLATVLDRRLVSSASPELGPIRAELPIGKHLPIEIAVPHCPPVPFRSAGFPGSKVIFAHKDSPSSRATLQRLYEEHSQLPADERPMVAVVLEGATLAEADAFQREVARDFPTFPDTTGAMTRGAGVRLSPTTLILDERAIVVDYQMGVASPDREDDAAAAVE